MVTAKTYTSSLNVSQLSDLATAAAAASEDQAIIVPRTTASMGTVTTQSTNDPSQVELADAANASEPVATTKSGDQYFPIQLSFAQPATTATTGENAPLTEEEKRRRTIIISSIILLILIVLVSIMGLKKKSK